MLNCFIKNIDQIEISSEDISLATRFCFPRIGFVCTSQCNISIVYIWMN